MSNIMISVTFFHILATLAVVGVMVISAVKLLQDRRAERP
jgi:hypothetical protein